MSLLKFSLRFLSLVPLVITFNVQFLLHNFLKLTQELLPDLTLNSLVILFDKFFDFVFHNAKTLSDSPTEHVSQQFLL